MYKQDHKLFKDEFKFNSNYQRAYLVDVAKIIGGFLRLKSEPNPSLLENGQLQDEHKDDHE